MDLSFVFSDRALFDFFFKAFAIVLSILFVGYSVIFYRQTQLMTRTLQVKRTAALLTISLIQLAISAILLILAIFLL